MTIMTMTAEMRAALRNTLINDEGWKNYPYVDTVGKVTIGCGFNLTDRGMPDAWISQKLNDDINYFNTQLSTFEWFKELNESRQIALVNMCFNVGFKNFCEFHEMIHALESHDYEHAANEMLSSKWAAQVKDRAHRLANIICKGEL